MGGPSKEGRSELCLCVGPLPTQWHVLAWLPLPMGAARLTHAPVRLAKVRHVCLVGVGGAHAQLQACVGWVGD